MLRKIIITILLILFINHVHPYSTNPTDLKTICCNCRKAVAMSCNFCTMYISGHACDLSGSSLESWAVRVLAFFEAYFLPVHDSNFGSAYAKSYFRTNQNFLSFQPANPSCTRHRNVAKYMVGSAIHTHFKCSSSVFNQTCGVGEYCDTAVTVTEDHVNYCYSNSATLPPPSLFWYDIDTYFNKIASPTGNCVEANYPALLRAFRTMSNPDKAITDASVESSSETSLRLKVVNTDGVWNAYRLLQLGPPSAKRTITEIQTHCTNDTTVTDIVFKNDEEIWTWFLNVLIIRRGRCSFYVPYSDTQDICADDLLLPDYVGSCPDSFRSTQFQLPSSTITLRPVYPPDTSTCDKMQELYDCGIKDWIDYFIGKMTSGTGPGSVDYVDHARLTDEYAQARQFGWFNWISSMFEPGVKLIFDIFGSNFEDYVITFFDKLLEYLVDIILEIFNGIVELFRKSQSFIDKLVDTITKILDVLFNFIAFVLKALVGVLLKLEQHFLLFEYIVLFLVINYYLINNNIFSLIVVFLVTIVIGIDRRSPSILLAFHNVEYGYVNLTGYDPSAYEWNYGIYYHSYSRNHTYNLTFPNLSNASVPVYNTTPPLGSPLPSPYPTESVPLNCSAFQFYSTLF